MPAKVTLEFQRKVAKELREYFWEKKSEAANEGPLTNGRYGLLSAPTFLVVFCLFRWAMFGFALGLLTENATGSDFVDQLKILLSNFGIADLQ
ncbi:hypothetical protein EJ110_NYTH01112 [Nymphaea thermarum]|nr:hypothetical protein EJ110_NYTH01112 [Nymphaea thermarum]